MGGHKKKMTVSVRFYGANALWNAGLFAASGGCFYISN